jgi:hypothetical protein
MTLRKGDRRRPWIRGLAFAGVAAAGYVFGMSSDRLVAQPPALPGTPPAQAPAQSPAPPTPKLAKTEEPDRRIVGYITSDNQLIAITREELGDFLIARGGHEKLELLANRKIVELEAARRGITVTTVEIKAKLEEDLRGLGVTLRDFERVILPRINKSLYEYIEDVIRPQLMLTKMCQDRVQVTDDDLQKAFENRYGERRQAQIIVWNEKDLKIAQQQWDEARKSDADFDRVATMQADPSLAAAAGKVKPIGKYPENAQDTTVVDTLFKLKPGEISPIIRVPAGLMCIKCVAVIPPEANVKLDEKIKAELHKEIFARKLEGEIKRFFTELREAAKPQLLLKGPPSVAEFREGVGQLIEQAGGVPPVPDLPPAPTGTNKPRP